jgi:AcrR family transcriptional regulator
MPTSTKKQDIVDTATRLFAKDGYHAVGIDRIIEESGVAKMTMYRNFSSKDDLVAEVLIQRAQQALASMTDAARKKVVPLERLHEVFVWHERWFKARDFTGCMFVGAFAEFHSQPGEIMRVTMAQKVGLRHFLQNLLMEAVPHVVAERLARQLVMLLDGAILSAMAGDRKNAASEAWDVAEKLISTEVRAVAKQRAE